MVKLIAPSEQVVQSESKVAGLLDQLKAVIRRSGLNNEQLQAIRDSGRLPTMFETEFKRLAEIVVNAVRLRVTSIKEFTKPNSMKQLVKGNDRLEPGVYEYTFEPFLIEGEPYIKSGEMIRRATERGAISGLQHALYLLENQSRIPTEFQGKKYLVFAGTEALVADRSDYDPCVACLRWEGGSWTLYWHWLGRIFGSSDLLVRARKV
jgi:hypothetical protein